MQEVIVERFIKQTAQGETTETRQEYQGRCVEKENGWFLTYKEEIEGIGSVHTVLKVEDATVTLIRQGSLQMKQLFVKGKSNDSMYQSPYGQFLMQTHTNKLLIERENQRPTFIRVSYQLWLSEQYMGEYDMELHVKWAERAG